MRPFTNYTQITENLCNQEQRVQPEISGEARGPVNQNAMRQTNGPCETLHYANQILRTTARHTKFTISFK